MKLQVTEQLLKAFREKDIYFSGNGNERLKLGDTITVGDNTRIEPYSAFLSGNTLCHMGSFSYSWSALSTKMIIGRYCSVAGKFQIMGVQHPTTLFSTSPVTYNRGFVIFKKALEDKCNDTYVAIGEIQTGGGCIIGNDVWIGANVTVKQGISVGDGSILAANATVAKDVPAYAVVGGNPARLLKYRFADNIIERLLQLKWWEYNFADFRYVRGDIDIIRFIGKTEEEIDKGLLTKYEPEPFTINDITASQI
jgi:acetyltransferase-like isoleucine patch superfamily enzyme